MFRKYILLTISILFILSSITIFPVYALTTGCESVMLFELKTQNILYEKSIDKKMYPASLTKIMTAIIALEIGNLDDKITVDEKTPYEVDGSRIALEPGEVLTLNDLLYALMLPSANDAASVIAKHYGGGSLEPFVKLMNDKAKELGATNTNFVNPHGLHDDNHYTTASDLAKITTYAMKNEKFREYIKTTRYTIPATNLKEERALHTTNNLLLNLVKGNDIIVNNKYVSREYEGAAGVKNGYTPEAGSCLVAYAQRNGVELISIVLKGTSADVYTDTHNLLNYGFDEFEFKTIISANEFVQDLELENNSKIALVTKESVALYAEKNTIIDNVKKNIKIYDVKFPIKKGDTVGKLEYEIDGKVIGATDIISTESVMTVETASLSNPSKDVDNNKKPFKLPTFITIIIAIVIAVVVLRIYNKIRIYRLKQRRKKRRGKTRQEGM